MDFQSLPKTQAKLIKEIKETMFSLLDIGSHDHLLLLPCAYETAWLAMIPDTDEPSKPMFEGCLSWVLNNQAEHGFWGNCDESGMPTLGCLTATLACVVALSKWNVGFVMISKGLEFIHSSNAKKILKKMKDEGSIPQWFAIIFPRMVELAEQVLNIKILKDQSLIVWNIFYHRQLIFQKEQLNNREMNLLSYLEVLPSSYFKEDYSNTIIKNLCEEGSLFQSPSATACAFMATRNFKCLHYLQTLAETFTNNNNVTTIPTTYPNDKDLIKLCIINLIERLGLAESFTVEIEEVLQQVYKNYMKHDELFSYKNVATLELYLLKESLAFRLLRMHGYKVFPSNICWFLKNEEIKNYIEFNSEYFFVAMLNLYRATDLAFHGEFELDELRTFSRKLLEKSISEGAQHTNPFKKLIEHELSLPWMARLDHLEHRFFIQQTNKALWMGKTSSQRLSKFYNDKLIRLATLNYEFKQYIYKSELEQLTRWNNEGLSGVSKKIFDALDNLVREMSTMYLEQQEKSHEDITSYIRKIWYETICSWLTESEWSKSGIVPTMEEYFKVSMTSVATHTLLLPASFLLKPTLKKSQLQLMEYESVTKLVMIICRLLNDLQSSEREREEGKPNSITVYMKNNFEIENKEEVVKYLKEILNDKKKEFLEHVLINDNGFTNLPKECRLLHLSCLKVFQMFFNSSNRYDSDTELLEDINKAIYIPLKSINHEGTLEKNLVNPPKPSMIDLPRIKSSSPTKKCLMNMNNFSQPSKHFFMNELSFHKNKKVNNWKITTPIMPLKVNLCFI
ncbi:(E,E)-geranyllinalool synthase isoform X2 [Cannabis sativa]|uniref:(E,E)-geranyllinalool synthase isoform X2 n=1 Tax=Cannabis sativa TaxID=3483 RepID=UPI0029CA4916|nr:(E,E)-geranyllinalool synthase isoform X2 [Cannabis sativa]